MQTLLEIKFPSRHEPEDAANLPGYVVDAQPVALYNSDTGTVDYARVAGLDIPISELVALPIVYADETAADMVMVSAALGSGQVNIVADGSLVDLCKLPAVYLLHGEPEVV